ncbi:MAG: DciA family protein [Limnothrix sp.]
MSLQPVDRILNQLMSTAAWQHQQRFQQIGKLWPTLLPEKSHTNSRPLQIVENILWVATASTTWSQHLNLQRRTLLKRLNQQISIPLNDLRFSAAHWHHAPAYSPLADVTSPHPSRTVPNRASQYPRQESTPTTAVTRWLKQQQHRHKQDPLCPQCQVPTPAGELERWQMCGCCIAQQWHKDNTLGNSLN